MRQVRESATQDGDIPDISAKKAVKRIEDQIIKKHLYFIILKALSKEPMSGYGIIVFVHREYGVLLGAGMVYNLLHSLEKRHIIKSKPVKRAKCYVLDKKGEEILEMIISNRDRIRNVANLIF
jgi:DNA-binding PadR family transcriptional regulator